MFIQVSSLMNSEAFQEQGGIILQSRVTQLLHSATEPISDGPKTTLGFF